MANPAASDLRCIGDLARCDFHGRKTTGWAMTSARWGVVLGTGGTLDRDRCSRALEKPVSIYDPVETLQGDPASLADHEGESC